MRRCVAIWCLALIVLVQEAHATQPASPVEATPPACPDGADLPPVPHIVPHIAPHTALHIARQMAVGPQGVLRARVADIAGEHLPNRVAGLRVRLLRRGRTVAVTATDPTGAFALRNLPGGLYLVVIDGPDAPIRRPDRTGTSDLAAPPVRDRVGVPIRDSAVQVAPYVQVTQIVRGQAFPAFPIMSLRQAAVVAGLTSGAIAAPAIYHNARLDNKLPVSP